MHVRALLLPLAGLLPAVFGLAFLNRRDGRHDLCCPTRSYRVVASGD